MLVQQFDGMRYTLVRTTKERKVAEKIANRLRKDGFYTRVTHRGTEYAVWRSLMPRWVIKWPKIS